MPAAIFRHLCSLALATMLGLSPFFASASAQSDAGDSDGSRIYAQNATPLAPADKTAERLQREERQFKADAAACEEGDKPACGDLGEAYELGMGTQQNRPIAAILYGEACAAGDADSCYRLGRVTRAAEDERADSEAAAHFERACELGSAQGCVGWAWALEQGRRIIPDPARAEAILRRTCATYSGAACRELAQFLLHPDRSERGRAEAMMLFEARCRAGDRLSCDELQWRVSEADQWPYVPREADMLYSGCAAQDAPSCAKLGDRAFLGQGMAQEADRAFSLYDRACELDQSYCEAAQLLRAEPGLRQVCSDGDLAACARLGEIYRSGPSVLADAAQAGELLSMACRGGRSEACLGVGSIALQMSDDPRSDAATEGAADLATGCEAGDPNACSLLANALEQGRELPEDKPRAYELFARLCDADRRSACEVLENRLMTRPDMPLASAGSNYIPPVDPEDPDALLPYLPEEYREARQSPCASSTLTFRGKTYSDTICGQTDRVLGGYALRPGQAPWQALLWRPSRLPGMNASLSAQERVLCGGSLIKRGWILTAAHCLKDRGNSVIRGGYRVRLGVHNPRADEGISYPITQIYPHPQFDSETFAFDIALVRYDPGAGQVGGETNSIARIALDDVPLDRRPIRRGMDAYTYGWGRTEIDQATSATELRGAKLQLEAPSECTRITDFLGSQLNSALCAAGRNGEQACFGDSGGPLIYYGDPDRRPRLIGVVSAGRRCGTAGEASRYTRIAAARDWIDRVLNETR